MDANKPTNNDAELLRRLNRFISDDTSVEDLREELINEGVNPDKLVLNVKNTISKFLNMSAETETPTVNDEAENKNSKKPLFKGILAKAKEMGIDNYQLADLTKLSVVLIAQFDRGLIKVNKNLPAEVVKRIAEAINVSSEQIFDYLIPGPRFAENAEYKSEDSPVLPDEQDFSDALEADPVIDEQRREDLRILIKAAGGKR